MTFIITDPNGAEIAVEPSPGRGNSVPVEITWDEDNVFSPDRDNTWCKGTVLLSRKQALRLGTVLIAASIGGDITDVDDDVMAADLPKAGAR